MPREYDYQDIEVRFGDLDLDRVPYQGQFLPPSFSPNLARETERFATEWWRHYAPVALQLDIYIRRDDVEFVATGAAGEHRLVAIPLHEFERDLHRSVEWALSQLLRIGSYDTVQPPMRPHWIAAPDAAVREVHADGTISLEPKPAPEPPRPRKTFWEVILEEE